MKIYSERPRAYLKVDARYGYEFLILAILRQAVIDAERTGKWDWLFETGPEVCQWVGIDPDVFIKTIRSVSEAVA